MTESSPADYLQSDYMLEKMDLNMASVSLSNYLPLLDERIKIQGFHTVLSEQHNKTGKTMRAVAKLIGIHEVTYQLYLKGKNRPDFKMLKKLSQVYGVDLLQVAFDANCKFVVKKKVVDLPRQLTANLVYYVGYLQGDGYLSKYGLHIGFCDEYREQMEQMNKLTKNIFGIEGRLESRLSKISKKPHFNLTVNSMAINSFLNTVFGINKGVKIGLRIPNVILSNTELTKVYLAGLYDADGTIPKNPLKAKQLFLDITLKDREFVEEIQQVLYRFGITSLKLYKRTTLSFAGKYTSPSWEIQIRRHCEIKRFLENISFQHPDKSRRAKEVLAMLA